MDQLRVGDTSIAVAMGDITAMDVDVIVNAANASLSHGGGVAAAIARAGGPVVQEESTAWVREHGRVGHGEAAITTAGRMPSAYVVHVVGPIYAGGNRGEEFALRAAVAAALDATVALGCTTVALPAISAGIYGYPRGEATAVIATECVAWARTHLGALTEIRLVAHDSKTGSAFHHALPTA